MIINSPEKHLTDQEFFTHIKFFEYVLNKKELPGDEENFKLTDLGIGSEGRKEQGGAIFNRIFMSAQILETPLAIDTSGYKFNEELKEAVEEVKKKSEKEQAKLLKILDGIKKGQKTKIEDIGAASWPWYELYNHIRFVPAWYKVPKEIEAIFRDEVEKYLDNFINDKLVINKKNYYKFEAQKRALIMLIEEGEKIKLYGNNFILTEKMDGQGVLNKMPDFCIVQTAYALQKLGYLKVLDVWGTRTYKESFETYHINVNVVLEESFIDEITSSYKKKNPTNIIEEFDEKRGVLKFAGQDIELSKKGKETDAVLLLKTLLKADGTEWRHNDQILEDWGYNDEDQKNVPKNKVYFAAQKINTAVALKTQIEDIVECNTSKARINPKYRKLADS